MNKLKEIIALIGSTDKLVDVSGKLKKIIALCNHSIIDFKNLELHNTKLIKENAKLTKQRSKFQCKLDDLKKEKIELLDSLKLLHDKVDYREVKSKSTRQKIKQLFKNHKIK